MRDLLVALIVFGSLPIILVRPYVGVLVWAWLGYMNPHRMTWDWAFDMPFAEYVAIALLVSIVISREPKQIPWSPLLTLWIIWVAWICVTTYVNRDFTNNPRVMYDLERCLKIQLITFCILIVMRSRHRIEWLLWVIVGSLGFFGIKGGIFTIITGGKYRVWGPPGGFVEGNNEIGLALIMILPLMRYLQVVSTRRWVRHVLGVAMALTVIGIVGTYSRGALVAGIAICLFLVWKSQGRWRIILMLCLIVPLALMLMPGKWFERMETIGDYQNEPSAMGRINAWGFAINLANDRPIFGGGFRVFSREKFEIYAPDPYDYHDAHSVYFEVLAEQGYVGLAIFIVLGIGAWRAASWVSRNADEQTGTAWTGELCRMAQVSLIGYAVGGAFLGLAYFDLYYNLVAFIILARWAVQQSAPGALRSTGDDDLRAADVSPLLSHRGARLLTKS